MSASSKQPNPAPSDSLLTRVADALIPARKREKRLNLEIQRLEAFLKSIPIEFCGWNQAGVQAISPGFCNLLGIAAVKSVNDIAEAFVPGDAAAFNGYYDRLQEDGARFSFHGTLLGSDQVLRISGQRGAVFSGMESFDVIWIQDISDQLRSRAQQAQALLDSEKREGELRAALDGLPFSVWMRDESLEITWCNRAYAQMIGQTPAAVVAEQKELPASSAQGKIGRNLAQQALRDGQETHQKAYVVIEGNRKLMEVLERPVTGESFLIGCAFDVSELEKVEGELDRYMKTQDEIMEQLRTAIVIFNANAELIFYNTAFTQYWGFEDSFLNQKPKLGSVLETLREQRRLPEQVDFRQFKNNWMGWFTTLLEPAEEMLYLPDGAVLRMVVAPYPQGGLIFTFEDVSSRLELETSYNTLIAVQRETLDNLAEGLVVYGEDGRLRLWNPAWARLWDFQPEDLEGAPHISKLVEKKKKFFDVGKWEQTRTELISCGLDRVDRKARLTRDDGSVLEYSVVTLPDGAVLNAYFNITDSVKVERALRERNAALEEAERVKLDFLANASYQLRTPLNAIMGFAEILNEQYFGKLNDQQKEYTGGIIDAGQRLVSLINDILDLSTIEAGYLSLYPSEVDIPRVMDSVDDLAREWARKQDHKLKIKCDGDIGVFVADERRVKQILINLVSNAINFSPPGSEIVVSAERTDEHVVFSVCDQGEGIPEEDQQRIFSPFERSIREQKKRNSGAGLGLSLVKRIVELHGGRIDLDSAPDKGTTISCYFPLEAVLEGADHSEVIPFQAQDK